MNGSIYKKCIVVLNLIFLLGTISLAQEHPGFHVFGRQLYDKCGEKVILRGVSNPNIWFGSSGLPAYDEIEQTGANVVRIVWDTNGTASQLDEAITNCFDRYMIPMVECHSATGVWSKLPNVVNYWTKPEIAAVLIAHEEYLLLNIANECGDYSVSATAFRTGYEAAILQIRDAGIHVPLVIDGTDWGKNINVLQSEGPALIEADPDHNLIFSIHMWWPAMYGYSVSDIADEIEQSVNMCLPLIVGEFSQMHGSCSETEITPQNSISYLTIIEQCQLNEVGWIAWSWRGNCNYRWDMTTDGTYATLYDWGLEVCVTDENSIQNTSERSYYLNHQECNTTEEYTYDTCTVYTSIIEENISSNGFSIEPNYPNPFSVSTQIAYEVFIPANVIINIYNIQGNKVKTLVNDWKPTGKYTISWNGENDLGITVSKGMYLCQITVKQDNNSSLKKSNKLFYIK
jgi:hypothetical protein